MSHARSAQAARVAVIFAIGGMTSGLMAFVACGCGGDSSSDVPSAVVEPIASPEALRAILATAQSAMVAGEPAKAEAVLRESVRTYPSDPDLRMALADLLASQGEHAGAHRQYEELIAIDPKSALGLFHSGLTARLAGNEAQGLRRLVEAANADPTNAEFAMQAGLALLAAGDLEEASLSLLRAAALDDARPVVWGSLAEIALRQGEASIAVEHARRALVIEPNGVAWTILFARAMKRTGEPGAALEALEALEVDDRLRTGVLATVGECCGLLGEPARAAAWYAEAAEKFPGDEQVAFDTATWFERAGDREQALVHARRGAGFGHSGCQALVERLAADD